ncbi:phosphoglycerate kinase [Siccirubricoccus sp. KC 17139]|uniref:Phosphoglycerate kinase n=1 Tax=Siccirubricoccus soli TaxID=2899147 RepID=A0ABT1D9G8_9PROT|nr:phosphoglycerate kinase [Siccirubricoccus soli]MCO6418567.1 phosphoglycerate kinase [Siccirubricoccus soli]MCP2684702.1 phosphoglycerate kinase [Siccirubricoccus soli]
MPRFRTLDDLDASGKRVLLRADLNVPMKDGRITDRTRIERLCPTIRELAEKGARVIICSHFDRPKGKRVPEMSLKPMAEALSSALDRPVGFADDCIGPLVEAAAAALKDGEVLLLENTRYHAGEEKNDPALAQGLAKLADVFVNDAFSAAHRAHASTEGVAHLIPAYAGRLMQAELEALDAALGSPKRPVVAIVGGAKVSTKLDLLGNLSKKVDVLVIGGAMANTFLAAQGHKLGKSLQEAEMHDTARQILADAKGNGCEILLPVDLVVATAFAENAPHRTVGIDSVPADMMALDVGPETVEAIAARLRQAATLVWNGPLGAFELPPFDAATVEVAATVASLGQSAGLVSIGGGGDTVAALKHAGVAERMTYVSAAGGAFLEWLEGKTLPGVAALEVKD